MLVLCVYTAESVASAREIAILKQQSLEGSLLLLLTKWGPRRDLKSPIPDAAINTCNVVSSHLHDSNTTEDERSS